MASSVDSTADDPTPSSLLRSSLIVGMMTFLSRIMGLVRDIVIAVYFGSKAEADAFFVAFKIPNFLRRLFAEGAFSQAFVPVLSQYRTNCSKQEVKQLINRVSGTLALTLSVVTGLCIVAAPLLTILFAPGFYQDAEKMSLATELLRITFPYLLFISLTAFAGSVLNSYGRFAVPAFTPVLLNLSLIGATVMLSPFMERPVIALGFGVLIAGVAQLCLQLPFMAAIGVLPKPCWGWQDKGVQRIIRLMLPALFGVSVSQINLLLDTILASFLATGSVSWLYYADRLSELPLGVFAIAISTVILPNLSRSHAQSDPAAFSNTIDWAIRLILLIAIPAAAALFLLAEPLIATLFYYGEMTANDVMMSAIALRAYSVGLVAFMLIKVLAPGFFARENTKTPVKIAVKAMVANMILNLILVWPLQHAGLALATSLSAFLNAGLLFFYLQKEGVLRWRQAGWLKFILQVFTANITLIITLQMINKPVASWLAWTLQQRMLTLSVLVIAGCAVYVTALLVCGLRPSHLKH